MSHDKPHQGYVVRKLRPEELDEFEAHLLRLDADSRRMRFAHSVSDAFIKDYAAHVLDAETIVFGAFANDHHLHAAAELRKLRDTWEPDAEAAFSVEREYQERGLGTQLMSRVIRSARNRKVQRLYMSCLAENQKMQAIARKHEAHLRFEYGEVVGEIVPEGSDYFSLLSEAVDDRVGYLFAVIDLSLRARAAA